MSETQSVNLVFEKVSFVSKISTILKATSDDDKPIPGYLYQEVSNITLESDGYCESTLEYLVDRLDKNSCHVKLKVLKLMKYIIEHGHQNFKLGLLKSSQGIMAATKFSGPPDPLHGNVPYVMVRKSAQELSEMLFDTEQLQTETTDISKNSSETAQQYRMGLGTTSTKTTGTMEGFGNSPALQNKSFGDNVRDNLTKIVDKICEGPEDYQKEVLSTVTLEKSSTYKPPASYHGNQSFSMNPKPVKTRQTPVVKHIPGRAGGGWEDEEEKEEKENIQGSSHSTGKHSSGTDGLIDRLDNVTIIEDFSVEENLVKSVIDDGQNFLLTRQEIVSFMKKCGELNCDKLLEFLNQRLQSESEAVNMRSLLLIENFLRKDLVSIEQITKESKENLLSLHWSKQGPVKSKTKKIIRTLERLQEIQILDDSKTSSSENLIDISHDTFGTMSKNSPT